MARGRLVSSGHLGVEGSIKQQDVDSGFAEDSELAAFGVAGDQRLHGWLALSTGLGYAANLEGGSRWADVGIETASGRSDEIDGDRTSPKGLAAAISSTIYSPSCK